MFVIALPNRQEICASPSLTPRLLSCLWHPARKLDNAKSRQIRSRLSDILRSRSFLCWLARLLLEVLAQQFFDDFPDIPALEHRLRRCTPLEDGGEDRKSVV